ncbi:MAG: L,D-transpeptidase family protein, partial [Ferruginibacter sp.]
MKIVRFYVLIVFCLLFGIMAFVPTTNQMRVAKTTAGKLSTSGNTPSAKPGDNPYYIIIDKSEYELKVYDEEGWYATYPIVFGSKDLSDKMRDGDKKTPDGHFKVIQKKIHPKWSYELLLDFPND